MRQDIGRLYLAGGSGPSSPAFDNIWLARYTPSTNGVTVFTFGGSNSELAQGLAIDSARNLYIGGATVSPDLATPGAFQKKHPRHPRRLRGQSRLLSSAPRASRSPAQRGRGSAERPGIEYPEGTMRLSSIPVIFLLLGLRPRRRGAGPLHRYAARPWSSGSPAPRPEQTYALYLPKGYTPERNWPILYAFDARSQGKAVAALFQSAAETYGWIVVSSWNTASDGPIEPNFVAMRALWADTHDRFAIDESRVYAAGFSGTVRFSCILALTAPGTIRGIIGAGAGFPFGTPPKRGNPFVFFGTVGDRDFNWYEMNDLDAALAAVGLPTASSTSPASTTGRRPSSPSRRSPGWRCRP